MVDNLFVRGVLVWVVELLATSNFHACFEIVPTLPMLILPVFYFAQWILVQVTHGSGHSSIRSAFADLVCACTILCLMNQLPYSLFGWFFNSSLSFLVVICTFFRPLHVLYFGILPSYYYFSVPVFILWRTMLLRATEDSTEDKRTYYSRKISALHRHCKCNGLDSV